VFTIIEEAFCLLHLQLATLHVKMLSNRVHRSLSASKRSQFQDGAVKLLTRF
jgi:hypothetical protein